MLGMFDHPRVTAPGNRQVLKPCLQFGARDKTAHTVRVPYLKAVSVLGDQGEHVVLLQPVPIRKWRVRGFEGDDCKAPTPDPIRKVSDKRSS